MFRTDRIIALDVGASKIVMAEFSAAKSGAPELLNYAVGHLDVDPESETDASAYIVSTIRQLMAERGIKPAPLFMTLSGQAVFPRYVKLPPVARDKVVQIIRYEAEQNVPFPIDEVVWDYQLISGGGPDDLNVMLVAVKIENITRLTDCVLAAGLEPEIIDAAPMALYNTVRYNYPGLPGCAMVLDIGARSSNLIFIEESRIFSRSIPVAGNAITTELMKEFGIPFKEAEELKLAHAFVAFGGVYAGPENETANRVSKIARNVITRLHAEINRSINFYRSQQGGQPPSLVLLTGGSAIIPHMDTFFREKLTVEVEYLNPFANIAVNESIEPKRIEGDLHLLGEVAGLALRRALTCPVEINLMPPDLLARRVLRRRQPFFILAGVGLILTMLCWWVYFHRMRAMLETRLETAGKRIADFRKIEGRLKSVQQEKQAVQKDLDEIALVIGTRTQWLQMIDAIHACLLDGMWLNSIRPLAPAGDRVEGVEIVGRGFDDKLKLAATVDKTPIVVYRDRLRESGLFSDKTELERQLLIDSTWEFTIRARLNKPIETSGDRLR
ncbi:MAG: type IV pilus assembly protein PilM [Verrucomicrobiota bacterium]|nr:type IV pilus assembly protein PilM [Verrucomicrobiota bacterium]